MIFVRFHCLRSWITVNGQYVTKLCSLESFTFLQGLVAEEVSLSLRNSVKCVELLLKKHYQNGFLYKFENLETHAWIFFRI